MDKKTEEFAGKVVGELKKANHSLDAIVGKPRKHDAQAEGRQDHSDNEDQRTERSPVSVCHAAPSGKQTHKPNYRRYDPRYWLEVAKCSTRKEILESIGILFAIGYAVVTFFQWHEMHRQTVEANRAWLGMGPPVFNKKPTIGSSVQIKFFFGNTGHSPGLDVKKSVFFDFVDLPPDHNFEKLDRVSEDFCSTNPPDQTFGAVFTQG